MDVRIRRSCLAAEIALQDSPVAMLDEKRTQRLLGSRDAKA